MESREERHKQAHFLLLFSFSVIHFQPAPVALWEVEKWCKLLYYLPASLQKSLWCCSGAPCHVTHGCKSVGLSPWVCDIPLPLSLLLPLIWHLCFSCRLGVHDMGTWSRTVHLYPSLGREDHACLNTSLGHQTGEFGDKIRGLCEAMFSRGSEAFLCCHRSSSAS